MTENTKELTGYPSIDKPWLKYYGDKEQNYNIPEMKIVDYMYQCTGRFEDETALEYMKVKVSYKEMRKQIENTACALMELGVKEGDTISVCLPNMPEVVFLFYAINKVGAVANMLDPRNSSTEFLRLIKDVNTKFLFVMDKALEKFKDVLNQAGLKGIVVVSVLESLPFLVQKMALCKDRTLRADKKLLKDLGVVYWKEFQKLGVEKPNINTVSYKPDAPAVICYTGGSTGVPKGAVMSDYNFNAYISGVTKMGFNANPGDSAMVVAPPWTMYGISNSINAYLCMGLMLQLFPKSGQDMFGMQICRKTRCYI